MAKRYTDNALGNRVDFVYRNYGISTIKSLIMMIVFPVFITIFCFFYYDKNINVIVNISVFVVIGLLALIQSNRYLKIISRVEYQNMIFANALNHNTEFCLIVKSDGKILYADLRFIERFKDFKINFDLMSILKLGNLTSDEIQAFQLALKNKTSIQTCFSISQKNKISNFSLILDPILHNPEITINKDEDLNLLLSPIARPRDYFVLKAVKISKEQVYERLIKKHCVGSYLLNSNGIIISANNSFLEMFELKSFKKGILFTDLLLKSHNKINKDEVIFSTFNGSTFHAHVTQAVFYDKHNNSYIYGLLTPIDSKSIDYRSHPCFIESPIAIAQCNVKGVIINKNKTLIQLIGQDQNSIFTIMTPEDCKKVKKYFNNNTINNMSMEVCLYNDIYVKIYFNKFIHNNNIFIICYFINSTDRKDLEIQLEHSQKMHSIGQLAGGIAHDFNNILTAITGFCDLLLIKHPTTDPSFSDIMQIKQNANRATNLIKQLLAFSRKQTLQTKILDVNTIIADLLHMIKRLINESIELKVFYDSNIGLIKADICQLEQVIINLVVNARAAMETGGTLTIKTYNIKIDSLNKILKSMFSPDKEKIEFGEYVVIEIADTGSGMSDNIMKKIFDPFFSTKETTSGTGLGLSTVYGIVKQTGGYIKVSSKVNSGTKFIILLPRIYILDDNIDIDHNIESVSSNISTPTYYIDYDNQYNNTILLIEDEDPVRLFTNKALTKKGYKVIDINCGKKALNIIKNNKIDLIISDVVMPGISGPEIVSEIIKVQPTIQVIFISGYAEEVFNKYNQFDIEKINFLPKPFTLKELTEKVSNVLNSAKTLT